VPQEPLTAHSLAEAYFYLMITPCASCGKGPLRGSDATRSGNDSSVLFVDIEAACGTCNGHSNFTFRLPHGTGVDKDTGLPTVNPTDGPSGIIDVAQWLTLFRVITAKAGDTADKADSRRLGLEAAQCLEEALKFYEDDNDLPPESACFSDTSRARFAEHPQEFSRQRLINLRAKLPNMNVMLARAAQDLQRTKRRWWRRK